MRREFIIMNGINLYIVIPCYNEEEVLHETAGRMLELMRCMRGSGLVNSKSRICFVDDGSRDATWEIINSLAKEHSEISGIKLACNAGHQNALFGGLMTVKDDCDCAVSIDADLQDDIELIPKMVEDFQNGYDVVYGVRNRRDTDTFFKRTTAVAFYKLMNLMGIKIIFNHADYRLMSRRALNALAEFPERNMFLRGMAPLVGFKSTSRYYDRAERFAGESKYPLKKMLSFAFDGITSFSVTPIRMISFLGGFVCVISIIMAAYTLFEKFFRDTGAGWASIMISVWFIGGVNLLSVGLIGEYIGKIYKEVKRRPRYIIEAYINEKDNTEDEHEL